MQVFNPLGYWCAPNEATPDYVTCHDFRDFVAYGLLLCWLSHDADDPAADCTFRWTRDDVGELRGIFLGQLETAVLGLWEGFYLPAVAGSTHHIGGDEPCVFIKDEDGECCLHWEVYFQDDAVMMELVCTGTDAQAIWLAYEAVEDRRRVVEVLTEAGRTVSREVWEELVKAASAGEKP